MTLAWLSNKTNILNYSFAILAPVALDLVAAPASQAYVQRASVCGDMCAGKCNRMSINQEQRVFLQINKKYSSDVVL